MHLSTRGTQSLRTASEYWRFAILSSISASLLMSPKKTSATMSKRSLLEESAASFTSVSRWSLMAEPPSAAWSCSNRRTMEPFDVDDVANAANIVSGS